MQIYATNETRTFCAMDDYVERSVLMSIKTKTVRQCTLKFTSGGTSAPKLKLNFEPWLKIKLYAQTYRDTTEIQHYAINKGCKD